MQSQSPKILVFILFTHLHLALCFCVQQQPHGTSGRSGGPWILFQRASVRVYVGVRVFTPPPLHSCGAPHESLQRTQLCPKEHKQSPDCHCRRFNPQRLNPTLLRLTERESANGVLYTHSCLHYRWAYWREICQLRKVLLLKLCCLSPRIQICMGKQFTMCPK